MLLLPSFTSMIYEDEFLLIVAAAAGQRLLVPGSLSGFDLDTDGPCEARGEVCSDLCLHVNVVVTR